MTTTPAHLLSLAALHTAAPGVLDVIFGADGDFDGAPDWRPPLACEDDWATDYRITDGACWVYKGSHGNTVQWLVDFDCRLPSVAARLVKVMWPLSDTLSGGDLVFLANAGRPDSKWDSVRAARLAALTLALASQIAALGASR